MGAILAIDQGTSGTKAVVVAQDGHVLATVEEPIRPHYLANGGVEQNPEELLSSVLSTGRAAVAKAASPIDAVAFANQGESVLAWDRSTGRPLSPILVWQDRRAEAWCQAQAEHRDRVVQLTGLELDPYFSAPKMRWLRDNFTRDGVVTTTDTWVVHQLCGAFVTDTSTASRSLIFDLDALGWSDELLSVFGLNDEDLPRVVPSDEIVGETDAFGPSIPVTGLIVDQQAALLAEACLEPGTAKCTFGTGAFVLAQAGTSPVLSGCGLTSSVAWTLRDQTNYCLDGQVYTAASAVRWAVDAGLLESPAHLDAAAAPDSDGVIFAPSFAGLAAPWWDPSGRASLTGMGLSTRPGHIVKALVEGIAAQVAQLVTLIGEDIGSPLERLRVDGGLTRSRTLMQAQADLSQIPVEVFPSAHATPLGAVACARMGLDRETDLSAAVSQWTPSAVFEPLWSPTRAQEHLDRWRAAATAHLEKESS